MDKYTRDSSLSVLVLEIQASLSVSPDWAPFLHLAKFRKSLKTFKLNE